MRSAAALLLLAGLLGLATVAETKKSTACPNGCIIASVVYPQRICECVIPSCDADVGESEQKGKSHAARSRKAGTMSKPEQALLGGVDCHFCERDAGTYVSFDECYAADAAFRPDGPSLDKDKYPRFADDERTNNGNGNGNGNGNNGKGNGNRKLLQTCPPAAPVGCADYAALTRWEAYVPAGTSDVVIRAGDSVVLHGCAQPGNTVTVASITVEPGATLAVSDSPLTLNMNLLRVNGTFIMGSPSCPITSAITVVVPGGNETRGVDIFKGASYDVHGAMQGLTWTRVSATVPAGSNTINLQEAVQWQPNQKIVLVTTTWKDEIVNQNEVLTIASVTNGGLTITTVETIAFPHYGGEYQAEVAMLTRRILFTSDATSTSTTLGPHTTSFGNNTRVTGAAFERWGARNKPGRYSLHFHIAGNAPLSYLKNNVVYNSNWRCITIHGTNEVLLQGNVGFNVHGHCYYLEDGVEERNVLDRNLAAYVHPIHTAGSGGGQQGTDRWQNATLFDPSDSGAAGFYSLNAHNTWINNAASGGFAGWTFPNAPRAIKDHKNILKADGSGYPFNPAERPLILFRNNTVHSTGYFWEHSACFYFGGVLIYKTDPSDAQIKLYYNNGRGSFQADPLCPDPLWPASDSDNSRDCWVNSARRTKNAADNADGFLVVSDSSAALCNVGIGSWGYRIEVKNFKGYDVTRGSEYLGQSWMSDSTFRINTTNTVNGWSRWPYSSAENWWDSWVIKGFEFYDTMTSSLLSNIVFDNYRYRPYPGQTPSDYWYWNTPHAIRMLSHSDQFKPDKTMMVTKGITCTNCDFGTCTNPANWWCDGGAFFRVDRQYTGSSWTFNWLDQDGSVVRHVQPTKPAGPYLISSYPDWWKLDDTDSWREPKFGNVWVSPMPAGQAAGRVEMRVQNNGVRYTVGSFDGQDITRIGYVSQFGDISKWLPVTKTEGTLGITGKYGMYAVFNTSTTAYHAPKRLELVLFNVPREKWIYWTSCWPAGTSFSVSKTFDWATCQNVSPMAPVATRFELLASGGNSYWVDGNSCLHLKLMDPGHPWEFSDSFQRDGMYIEEEIRWYDLRYVVTATGPDMSCSDTNWCPLPGDPASRLPAAITDQPPTCLDTQPADSLCGSVKCAWTYWPGCSNSAIVSGGLCKASCGTCASAAAPPSPPPPPPTSPPPPAPSPPPPSPPPSPPLPSPPPPPPRLSPPPPTPSPPPPLPSPPPPPPRPSPPPSPPPPPPPPCKAAGNACSVNSQCCSLKCNGNGKCAKP